MKTSLPSDSQIFEPQKKYVYISFLVLFCCIAVITTFLCMESYNTAKKDLMQAQSATLDKDTRDTVAGILLWRDEIVNQSSRLSSSEMYRLFASEAGQLDGANLGRLNEAENMAENESDLSVLAAQIPLMRNVLLDFINYTGISDARIINGSGHNLLSVLARPSALSAVQLQTVRQALQSSKITLAPVRSGANALLLDVADPLRPVMSAEGRDKPNAALLLSIPITAQVGRILAQENRFNGNASVHILQQDNGTWQNIRVHSIDTLPEATAKALDPTAEGAIPFAHRPGIDKKGDVYSLGIRVPGMDWWIVAELPAAIIQEGLQSKKISVILVGIAICAGFLLLTPLLWWFTVGRGQQTLALHFRELYHTIQQQKQLLDSINMSLEMGLFTVDPQGKIQHCNPAFASLLEEEEDTALVGKGLFMLFKGASSEKLLGGVALVLHEKQKTTLEVERTDSTGETRLFRTTLFPLVGAQPGEVAGVVGTMQDITEFRRRYLLQQKQQAQTMSAFMRAIESVDPYLAGHSQLMKALGALVGKYMHLEEKSLNTICMAAELSQVGKLYLPQGLLGKEGKLTENEMAEMRLTPHHAYSILKEINFDLPVADAVYGMHESLDGKGYPRGVSGSEIGIHSRILAVLNSFCALLSPRSYREPMDKDKALDLLSANGGLDQEVVKALRAALNTPEGAQVLLDRNRREKPQES